MRTLGYTILTLVLLLALALGNGYLLTSRCDTWDAQLNAVESAASWEEAAAAADTLEQDWKSRQVYLHIIVDHDEISDTESTMRLFLLAVRQHDGAMLRSAATQLHCQFRLLEELEQLSIKNVL